MENQKIPLQRTIVYKEKSSQRTSPSIRKMDNDQMTSTKTLIHPTQLLFRLQLPVIIKNQTQYALMTHMTISTLRKIPTKTLVSFIHKNKTYNILILKNNNDLDTQMTPFNYHPS